MKIFIGLVTLLQAVRFSESACTFPTAFQNTWLTNSRGTWTVNSSTISNFPAQAEPSASALFNMDCEEVFSGYYVLKSQETVTPFSGPAQYNVYTCLYLEQQSDYNYIYSLLTQEFTVALTPATVIERITLGSASSTLSGASVCSDTAYTTAGERVHVALLNGSESLGKADCPSILQGYFTYLGTTCNSTFVDVCTDTKQLAFNTTACTQNIIYSQNGSLDCVYQNTIGSYTYVTVYNEDSSVDGSTYYAFSCLVVSEAGVYTYASVKPTECEANQVSTTTPTGGYVTVFEETATSTTSTEDLTYLYVILGIIVLLIIITIIILLICCIKCRKRLKDVESADDESDKGSEDSKSGDAKPDEDDSKPEEGEEQQRTKTDEDKQSVDSGFIPGKDESKQKKKRRRRRKRKRRMRPGDEGEEEEDEEDDDGEEEEETSSGNVAQPDEHEDKPQPEQQGEETVTDSTSKLEETETINQQPLAHIEEKTEDSESDDSHSQNEENMEPEPDQISKKDDTMDTDNDSSSLTKPTTEPETQYKSNHSLEREGDGHHSQNEEGSDTEESKQVTQSQSETSVVQENNTSPLRNDDGTKQESPLTSRMEEGTKEENTAEQSDDDGSGTDGEGDDKGDDGVTLKNGKRIDGGREGTDEDVDEEQGGPKKTGGKHIVLPGLLSKVLVTREMEEKSREKASRRKIRSRVGRLFAFKKSKKQGASDENQDEEMNDPDVEDVDRQRFAQPVAPFMEQYHTKKDIEKKLDDAHYWDLPEDDNIVMQLDQIEEELEKEEQKEIQKMEVDVKVIGIENANVNEGEKTTAKEEANNVKNGEGRNGSRSSSRAESPQSKKVRKADSSSDLESDVFDLDDDCLPEGHIRNENGNIVRMADGKVYKPGQFQRHLKKATLKRIFNVPRLNRNKKGRPTGGIKDDTFGPETSINDTAEQADNEKNEREDGRISGNAQRSSDERKRTSESRRRSKTVAFSVAIDQLDQFGNPIGKEEQPRIDSSTVNRRKLKNRLFRKKKRKTEDLPPLSNGYGSNGPLINVPGGDGDRPRELSNMVKVYGQPGTITSTAPRSTLPPIGLARSNTSTFDRNQLQNFREGLSKDQQILEKANTIGSNPLSQPLGVRRISVEELSNEGGSDDDDVRNGIVELGNEDEFFLVGGPSQSQNEPLFTRVRPPPHSDLARALKSRHDQRHAIPWSILNAPPGRPHTDGNDLAKSLDAPRSADTIQRGMDEKRLRELLEELYKDKKYFDHVIDTTAPKEDRDIDDRDLAEHGRHFLLDRADFWEDRGPLPSRPPRTSLGMRMSRMQTMINSGRVSMTSTNTCTPPVTELPNQMPLREENTFS
ncbi:hypothetical protein KP79_PYT13296 [Mizuhopecten yessoensis]|uniref:DUF7042 domain-containing protein n=1 Tax=Mizuhopecten yessoensis TaxID=6573 RepID=A0A210R3Q9_MIZYE|nr:hypothetical protein KP79_PYT13296 [Mizuhopecten yessoensis]